MENGDDWLALDKLQHFLLCFFLTIMFSLIAARSRSRSFMIRNRSIWVGSIVSLVVGAAKEFADEMGYFMSAGASVKDAFFDLLGTLVAALALYLFKLYYIHAGDRADSSDLDLVKVAEMV